MKKFTTAIATVLALISIFATSARAESPKPVDRVETCVVVDTVFDGYEWDVSIEDMQGNIWSFIDRENFWEVGMEGSFWFNDNATPNDLTDDEMEGLYHENPLRNYHRDGTILQRLRVAYFRQGRGRQHLVHERRKLQGGRQAACYI